MEVCMKQHDEIVFDGSDCPLCRELKILSVWKKTCKELEEELDTLKETLCDIEKRNDDVKREEI